MQEKIEKNTDISERILQIIDCEKVNRNVFAQKLGYERSQTIYDILNNKSLPSYDFFLKFVNSEYSEKYNILWLLSGKGDMFIDKKQNFEQKSNEDELKAKDNKLNSLENRIRELQLIIDSQKETIETQKELIKLLKSQSKMQNVCVQKSTNSD